MATFRTVIAAAFLALFFLLSGCAHKAGSYGAVPLNQQEMAMHLPDSDDAALQQPLAAIGTMHAGESYTAASGMVCKAVVFRSEDDTTIEMGSRVACDNGQRWFLTDNIFKSN